MRIDCEPEGPGEAHTQDTLASFFSSACASSRSPPLHQVIRPLGFASVQEAQNEALPTLLSGQASLHAPGVNFRRRMKHPGFFYKERRCDQAVRHLEIAPGKGPSELNPRQ